VTVEAVADVALEPRLETTERREAGEWFLRIVITQARELAWLNGSIGGPPILEEEHRRRRAARAFVEGARRGAYLSRVRCSEGYRRSGLASRLIESFCAQSAERKVSVCLLDVDSENSMYLIGFYRRRGFILLAPETKDHSAFMGRRLA